MKLAPSILAADFACLGAQVAEAEKAGAERIHIDVVDGHFVPDLSMGAPIVASLRSVTRVPLETHLMISKPDLFLQEGIRAPGKRAGIAINPATPADVLEESLPDVDQVLVMTIDPGFGRQHFLHFTPAKIGRVRQMIDRVKPECDLEVDGGIDSETARLCVKAGANVLVAGSSVFGTNKSVPEAMSRLRTEGE